MRDARAQIEMMCDCIAASDEISDADREALIEFSHELYLLQTKHNDHRHLKLVRRCTRMAEHVGELHLVDIGIEAILAVGTWSSVGGDPRRESPRAWATRWSHPLAPAEPGWAIGPSSTGNPPK